MKKPKVGDTEILDDRRIFIFDADGTWHYYIKVETVSREDLLDMSG